MPPWKASVPPDSTVTLLLPEPRALSTDIDKMPPLTVMSATKLGLAVWNFDLAVPTLVNLAPVVLVKALFQKKVAELLSTVRLKFPIFTGPLKVTSPLVR